MRQPSTACCPIDKEGHQDTGENFGLHRAALAGKELLILQFLPLALDGLPPQLDEVGADAQLRRSDSYVRQQA